MKLVYLDTVQVRKYILHLSKRGNKDYNLLITIFVKLNRVRKQRNIFKIPGKNIVSYKKQNL